MKLSLIEVENKIINDSTFKLGCILDTNILFAASYPLDPFNEFTEEVIELLHSYSIPLYTNLNVRSEFIDLNRRVLIPEGLLTMFKHMRDQFDAVTVHKFKSLRSNFDRTLEGEKTFKLSDYEIKRWRHVLSDFTVSTGETGWELFCDDFFYPFIKNIWDDVVTKLKISFAGTKKIDDQSLFHSQPDWSDMINILGRTGIGTSDAMILNLFLKSKFPLIITTDSDISTCVDRLMPQSKYVVSP